MKIYADTNIYCRCFDDRSQLRIAFESESIDILFDMIKKHELILITSDILNLELSRIDPLKQIRIKPFLAMSRKHVNEILRIKDLAYKINSQCKIDPRDALHLSSAVAGNAKIFLTCDDGMLKKSECVNRNFSINVVNPIQFIQSFIL